MISHKHKYIYYHITKCGGTAIESALLKAEGIKQKLPYKKWIKQKTLDKFNLGPSKGSGSRQHCLPKHYSDSLKKEYFTFTFVRNPYERCLSEFLYLKKVHADKVLNITFLDYMKSEKKIHPSLKLKFHDIPMHFYTEGCNFIGRLENLQEDFNIVCDKIGIPQQELPHKNKTSHKHYSKYYDEETKQIVAEKYAKDFEYFGYEF